jgi:iron complex transport system substrate-binding protein
MLLVLISVLWLALALHALFSSVVAQTRYPVTIAHDAGSTAIPARPTRVVALDEYALDLLLSLGVQPVGAALRGNTIAAGTTLETIMNGYFKPYLNTAPVSAGLRGRPSVEVLVSLKPDLMVGTLSYNKALYTQASSIAPTLLFDAGAQGAWRKALPVLARALSLEPNVANVVRTFEASVNTAKRHLEPITARRPRMLLITNYLEDYLAVSNGTTAPGQMLELLGFSLVAPGGASFNGFGIAETSLEAIARLDPDMIVTSTGIAGDVAVTDGSFDRRRHWDANPILAKLAATRAGRVYFFDAFDFNALNGPLGLGILAQRIARTVKP